MATMVLTEKNPRTLPGAGEQLPAKSYLGWQMSTANAADFVVAINTVVGNLGYIGNARAYHDPATVADPDTGFVSPTWLVTLTKKDHPTLECVATQWVLFDGVTPMVKDDATVQADYDITEATQQ